jgi:hypothetical protein
MQFITKGDINDAILPIEDSDVNEANRFVTDIGIRLGVAEGSFVRPFRYPTYRLAVVYACYLACLRMVGSDGSVVFDGKENADIYAQKLAFYRNEAKLIESRLTASDFADGTPTGARTIELWRG